MAASVGAALCVGAVGNFCPRDGNDGTGTRSATDLHGDETRSRAARTDLNRAPFYLPHVPLPPPWYRLDP